MAPYTTLAQVQRHLAEEIAGDAVATVTAMIGEATSLVESVTGMSWAVSDDPTTRRFECSGEYRMSIDHAQTVDAVTLCIPLYTPQALTEDADYVLIPGGSGGGVAPNTITGLWRIGSEWPDPPAYVEVTAEFGAGTVPPDDIALATAWIVAAWCRAVGIGSAHDAATKSESWGDYSVTYGEDAKGVASVRSIPPEAQTILDAYVRNNDSGTWVMGVG